jgi:hypothetical protein
VPLVAPVAPVPSVPGVPGIAGVAVTLAVLDSFNRRVAQDNAGWVRAFGRARLPQQQALDLQADEAMREVAFAKASRDRVTERMSKAAHIEDAAKRMEAVRAILSLERHYAALRSQAVAVRANALENFTTVRAESPEGALWMLNPLVKNHTADCLALQGRFLPWSVLDDPKVRPPRHFGCRCYLLGARDAQVRGLWNGLVPTHDEAMELLSQIMPDDDEHDH